MKQLYLLGISLLAVSACTPQSSPPPPASQASMAQQVGHAAGSPTDTTNAFDGDYGRVIVRQVSPGCADPRFSDVNLTIRNGLAQAQGLGLTFQGYVTPQGALAMQSDRGQTFQGQIGPNFVLTGRGQGPNCAWDVTWNRTRAF